MNTTKKNLNWLCAVSSLFLLLITFATFGCKRDLQAESFQPFKQNLSWKELPLLPDPLGVAGAFAGVHNDTLIVAGGANFVEPIFEQKQKHYSSNIYLLKKIRGKTSAEYQWIETEVKTPYPVAYGVSIATDKGLLCIGGENLSGAIDQAFLLSFDIKTNRLIATPQPQLTLPFPLTQSAGVVTSYHWNKAVVYLTGGSLDSDIKKAQKVFWEAKLASIGFMDWTETDDSSRSSTSSQKGKASIWKKVESKDSDGQPLLAGTLPCSERILSALAWQHDGKENTLFLFSGRRSAEKESEATPYALELLTDAWKFHPSTKTWKKLAAMPECIMAGAAYSWGLNHICFLNGTSGDTLKRQIAGEKIYGNKTPCFQKDLWIYHTVSDSWNRLALPENQANQLTTPPVRWGSDRFSPMVIVSGEIAPRVRTPKITMAQFEKSSSSFGFWNFAVVVLYLLGVTGVGVFFYFRNRNIDDFLKGGGRIPFWVAAFSIFATMLSSITFIAIPGKVFATDWCNYLLNVSVFIVTPFVITFFLPFFRQIKSASAYEYLEKRFNLLSRLFASTIFILYHIMRMGIVMYLPALALSSIIKISPNPQMNMIYAILIMGILSMIYCSLGGLEAVVWTDTIQSFVLLSGALITVIVILSKVGGFSEFFHTAFQYQKFTIAVPDFSRSSFTRPVLWVILLGGIGQNLIPYASDQSVIQRYMSVKDSRSAKKSIWTNTFISVIASALFFFVGTSLFVFYKKFSHQINPSISKVDEIFPSFIVNELPVGISGLVVAAILAAAQSTVSTSINSATAVVISDFVLRFKKTRNEKQELFFSRITTFVFGLLGTGFALFLVTLSNPSLWDSFIGLLGLVLGALCGMFLLGIFFKQANGMGANVGILLGIAFTLFTQQIGVHPYLLGFINSLSTMLFGLLFSLILKLLGVSGEMFLQEANLFQRIFFTEKGNAQRFSYSGLRNSIKKKENSSIL